MTREQVVSDLCKKNKRNSNEEVVETKGKKGETQEDSCKARLPNAPWQRVGGRDRESPRLLIQKTWEWAVLLRKRESLVSNGRWKSDLVGT